MTILYILAAILLLGILVTVHEFGHFFAARLVKIQVQEFSIGFGPKLLGWKSRKYATKFSIRAIPLGGYCMFYDSEDEEGKPIEHPEWAYNKQSVGKRMFSLLMGPAMNLLLAFVVAVGFYAFTGLYDRAPGIGGVVENGVAYEAGIEAGDRFYAIDGEVLTGDATAVINQVQAYIIDYKTGDAPLQFEMIKPNDTHETYDVVPEFSEESNRNLIGVNLGEVAYGELMPITLWQAIEVGYNQCVYSGGAILTSLRDMIFKGQGLDQASGPVGIITAISEQTRENGIEAYIGLLILISINLGLFNLLPIPGLDGSRFIFLIIEAIRKKPIDPKKEAVVHMIGYGLLFLLIIIFTFQDIVNLFK